MSTTMPGSAPAKAAVQTGAAASSARRQWLRPGLPAKLLVLTTLFVMLAEVLIYVPSVANFRRNWLLDKIAAAQVAALVLEGAGRESLPEGVEMRLLDGIKAEAIALRVGGARRLLSRGGTPPEVARTIDMRDVMWHDLITDAFAVLLAPVDRPIRVVDSAMGGAEFVEIIIDEAPLRAAMIRFSGNILLLSLLISAMTAGLVYLSLHRMIVRPVRRLAANVMAFEANPENPGNIIVPSQRSDEIGDAERAVSRMEMSLADQLRERQHLAALGLAVSKISHDLRNMLTSAQLLSDRLTETADPQVQRFAPRLIATLGRAVEFCQATLNYGRASENPPQRRAVSLRQIVAEAAELAGAGEHSRIAVMNAVPPPLMAPLDPDQMTRVLTNLIRNAAQALEAAATPSPQVMVSAEQTPERLVIEVRDNGPGVPERARQYLFEAFRGSVKAGGTGLGLAIAAELTRLHGGMISLEPSESGALFRIQLPNLAPGVEP